MILIVKFISSMKLSFQRISSTLAPQSQTTEALLARQAWQDMSDLDSYRSFTGVVSGFSSTRSILIGYELSTTVSGPSTGQNPLTVDDWDAARANMGVIANDFFIQNSGNSTTHMIQWASKFTGPGMGGFLNSLSTTSSDSYYIGLASGYLLTGTVSSGWYRLYWSNQNGWDNAGRAEVLQIYADAASDQALVDMLENLGS